MSHSQAFGIIPAAGRATRLGLLPCSKEILPVGLRERQPSVRVAISSCLENMRASGIKQAVVGITSNKQDLAIYLGEGEAFEMDISCHVIDPTQSTPETVAAILPFAKDNACALAFPDILFDAPTAYGDLLAMLAQRQADVVLGLFPADRPHTCDMVAVSDDGELEEIDIKPQKTHLTHTWGIAVWNAAFSQFLLDAVRHPHEGPRERYMGDVVMAAKRAGMHVLAQTVCEKPYIDVGTPEGLRAAWRTSLT